jgi:hypothetical protein
MCNDGAGCGAVAGFQRDLAATLAALPHVAIKRLKL